MSKLEFLLAGYVLTQTVYLVWAIYRDRRLLASKEKDELIMARMRYLEMDFRAAADRNVKIEQMLAGRETFSLEGKKISNQGGGRMSKDGAGPGLAYSETRSASSEEVRKLKARVKKLEAALKEAVEALRFYSSDDHWFGPNIEDGKRLFNKIGSEDCHPVTSPDRFVGGKMARDTLARIEEVLK